MFLGSSRRHRNAEHQQAVLVETLQQLQVLS